MRLVLVTFFILSFSIAAAASITVPETIIELSIYDLIQKKQSKYHLPSNYGDRVAKLIMKADKMFTGCLTKERNFKKVLALIQINKTGKAETELIDNRGSIIKEKDKSDQCIVNLLSEISYPEHQLKKKVSVKLPLDIKFDIL